MKFMAELHLALLKVPGASALYLFTVARSSCSSWDAFGAEGACSFLVWGTAPGKEFPSETKALKARFIRGAREKTIVFVCCSRTMLSTCPQTLH